MKEFEGKVAVVTGAASGIGRAMAAGLAPEQVADVVFSAIRDEKFYILTHPELNDVIGTRMQDILEGRSPTHQPVF